CGKAIDKIIEPTSQVHLMLSHPLQRRVETSSVAVIILTDREQPLEIVASPIQAKRRQQPRGPAIAVHKRMDMHQLELCDAADQYRMNFRGRIQPGYQLRHQWWDIERRGGRINRLPRGGGYQRNFYPPVYAQRS